MNHRIKIADLIIWAFLLFCVGCVFTLKINDELKIGIREKKADTVYIQRDTVYLDSLNNE